MTWESYFKSTAVQGYGLNRWSVQADGQLLGLGLIRSRSPSRI